MAGERVKVTKDLSALPDKPSLTQFFLPADPPHALYLLSSQMEDPVFLKPGRCEYLLQPADGTKNVW